MSESIQLQHKVDKIISQLNNILHNTKDVACCVIIPQGGSGGTIVAGLTSLTVTQTGSGNVVITPAGGSPYTLTASGETYSVSAPSLPAFTITGTSAWKWYGV